MKLQIALDDITYEGALTLLGQIADSIDIIELGTPFAYTYPLSAIGELKKAHPGKEVFADYKILDGGEFMANLAFGAGADMVSVSASAHEGTIAGAVKAAKKQGRKVLADMMGLPLERIAERSAAAARLGADYLCVHTSLDVKDADDPLACIREAKRGAKGKALVAAAGGIRLETLPRILEAAPDLVIVGGAIIKSPDPKETAARMAELVRGRGMA